MIACLAEGHSVTAFAGLIGVARSTVFKWAAEIPEFSDALRVGQAQGLGTRRIAKELKIGRATVIKALRVADAA